MNAMRPRAVLVLVLLVCIQRSNAVSWPVQGEPIVFERRGNICFRAEKYFYAQSVISFLNRSRDLDESNAALTEVSVWGEEGEWRITSREWPSPGRPWGKNMEICHGQTPPGFVQQSYGGPMREGVHDIQMEGRADGKTLRLYSKFCVSNAGRLVACAPPRKAAPSLWSKFMGWLTGGD